MDHEGIPQDTFRSDSGLKFGGPSLFCFAGYGLRLQGFEGSGVGRWSPKGLRPRRGEGGERGEELAVAGLVCYGSRLGKQ